jgi:site-specific recombinase XerD
MRRAVLAADLLERGKDIRTIRELLSHRDAQTTLMDTHRLNRGP